MTTNIRLGRILMPILALQALAVQAQSDIELREQSNIRVEYRVTQKFLLSAMAATILTDNWNTFGFAYLDGGIGYKLGGGWGVNANYRQLYRRNKYGGYDRRHVVYADLDVSKGLPGNWSFGATLRLQGQFYGHIWGETLRPPAWYARTRARLRYKVDYYWAPFAETELFTPLFRYPQPKPDQWRVSLGFEYVFNRHVRVEFYEQMQRELNTPDGNIFLMTAMNWGLRF